MPVKMCQPENTTTNNNILIINNIILDTELVGADVLIYPVQPLSRQGFSRRK